MMQPSSRVAFIGLMTACLAVLAIPYFSIIGENAGVFLFAMDDPYIHLRVAENIASGSYGINPGELSSPSSSFLWPIILAPIAGSRYASEIILIINSSLGLLLFGYCYLIFYARMNNFICSVVFAVCAAIAANIVQLAYTGMEHSLHVLLCAMIAGESYKVCVLGHRSQILIPALILCPLIRYEGLAATTPTCILIFLSGYKLKAIAAITVPVVILSGFSLLLEVNGLGILPSSILVKTKINSFSLFALFENARWNISMGVGGFFSIAIIGFLSVMVVCRGNQHLLFYSATAASVVILHLAFGQNGWFNRYEVYAVAFSFVALALIILEVFRGHISDKGNYALAATFTVLTWSYFDLYVVGALRVAKASRNVYEQQYQMSRFAKEFYRDDVAVNDIELVAYGADYYVLDLWGLGSSEARKLRLASSSDALWMADLTRKKGVGMAMIYSNWYRVTPKEWILVGTLSLSRPAGVLGGNDVSFYATDCSRLGKVSAAITRFANSLPHEVRFTKTKPNCPSA